MTSRDWEGAPLQEYPDRSVWTTWALSYNAIRERHVPAANLLLLWAFLDNKDVWYGLFAKASSSSKTTATVLSEWLGDLAISEVDFAKAIQLLRNYSLIEKIEGLESYATHPVVHRWAYYFQGKDSRVQLAQLAVIVVGWSVPHSSSREYSALQRRLIPHAQACARWVLADGVGRSFRGPERANANIGVAKEQVLVLGAIDLLGSLYINQGKLAEAEQMYERALQGKEQTLGAEHTSTLDTVNNLGNLYFDQDQLLKAKQMYERALQGKEQALGAKHTSTLNTVNNLGTLYANQGQLVKAEQMYKRALQGTEQALGTKHTSTLDIVNNLGALYFDQGKLVKAEQMYKRALQGKEQALGAEHTSTLDIVNNLGNLYFDQDQLVKAKHMYERALQGKEQALGAEHTSTLDTVNNLGVLYANQGKLAKAEQMYERALKGYKKAVGIENVMTYLPALNTIWNLGDLFKRQGDFLKARIIYSKALVGFEKVVGPDDSRSQKVRAHLRALDTMTETEALEEVEVPVTNSQRETSRLGAERAPQSTSKRHKLLKKIGLI